MQTENGSCRPRVEALAALPADEAAERLVLDWSADAAAPDVL